MYNPMCLRMGTGFFFLYVFVLIFQAVRSETGQHARTLVIPPILTRKHDFGVNISIRNAFLNVDGPRNNMPLQFVHITKTGGTSVENAACKQMVAWGMYTFPPRNSNHNCPSNWTWSNIRGLREGSLWHLSPRDLRPNPYINSNTFSIIRHPYLRAVSEYHCPWTGYKGKDHHDPRIMNKWLREKIMSKFDNGVSFLPQHDYVRHDETQHVIFHEHMHSDFPKLMKYYDLEIVLKHGVNKARYMVPTVFDLENSTIALINKYSKQDFDTFGYKMTKNDIVTS